MKIIFLNVPNIKFVDGAIYTGPNAGSRWPFTMPGKSFGYAPFPFWMAWAAKYVESHGFDVYLYDAVALRHDTSAIKKNLYNIKPDIIFYDVATPTYEINNSIAKWAKNSLQCRNVFCGPHMKVYAKEILKQKHVDNCVIGEYDIPALDICQKTKNSKELYTYELLKNIDTLPNGENFIPFRPWNYIGSYYDPSMNTPRVQLTMQTSRGCPFKCTYCQWPKVINDGKYRARKPEFIIDEIKMAISATNNSIGSIFFDDDTWNLGKRRVEKICDGLKEIGLPWTMMGRIDTSTQELYKKMVDSGCVGMRFGIETFNQKVSNNVKKKLDTTKAYDNLKYIVTNFRNMEFHFTTMKNLPGEPKGSWEKDQEILKSLQAMGAKNNNKVHWQISECIPFPGTELWEELVDLGHGEKLKDFSLYDGTPGNNKELAKTIGWLGEDYQPKFNKYSGIDGKLTNYNKEKDE